MDYKYVVLTNTTVGAFMAVLDGNVVLIALPTIIANLPGTSSFDGIWIIMGYTLITATLLLTFGRLSDVFGRVRLYTLGFAVFTVGSALCSLSTSGIMLVVFRLVQGTGGALIFSNGPAILTDVFPPEERGRALGINQVAGTAGSVGGLVAGGVLTAMLGWRSIFWINIPVGLFATVWAFKKLRETSTPSRNERLDPAGNVLFGGGLSLFLLGLTLGALTGFTGFIVGTMVLGLALLGGFIFVETRTRFPMIDLSLFRIRQFSAGILSNLLAAVARGSISLVLVFYFQGALGLDPLTAGLLLIPLALAFVTFGPLCGYLSDRYGSRGFATAGVLILSAALFWFSLFPFGAPYAQLVYPMILAGVGGGMFVAPNIASIMNATPPARRGVASGTSYTLLNTGFLLSMGSAFAIMAVTVPVSTLQSVFAGQAVALSPAGIQVFVDSIRKVFLVMGVVSLFAAVPASLTGRRKAQKAFNGDEGE
ncbi:MAG: MFS transporter [Nitrososphaerales archaeon]|nr:MFS transporter [Nitrososphaerales archaeon]